MITKKTLGTTAFLGIVENVKAEKIDFQGIHIEQDDLSRFLELGHRDQADSLPSRPFDDRRLEFGLIADKIDVWTLADDERILILKRVAPCTREESYFHNQCIFSNISFYHSGA